MNNEQMLANLILENPSLNVFPLIGESYINYIDLNAEYTISKIGTVFKSNYCWFEFDGEKSLIIEGNLVIIENYLYYKYSNKINKEEFIKSELDNIKWKTAIFFYVTYN